MSISVAVMSKTSHNRTITPADRQAADRLKSLWLALPRPERPTQQQLADAWDGPGEANQSLISQYMNGQIALNYRAVLFFARQLGCTDTDIRDDLPEQAVAGAPHADTEWRDITAYSQAVGLGAGTEAQEYAETHALKFKANSLRRKGLLNRRLSVYYGKGDSMEPRIKEGDAILFDEDDIAPVHGGIFIVEWRGEIYAKRIQMVDDLVLVACDNPRGDHHWSRPKRLDNLRDPITILGRVRWIGSWEE